MKQNLFLTLFTAEFVNGKVILYDPDVIIESSNTWQIYTRVDVMKLIQMRNKSRARLMSNWTGLLPVHFD